MNTNNIISTPEITGNIGNCSTQKVESLVHGGLLNAEHKVLMTNSCTGQVVENYNYTDYTLFSPIGLTILLLIVYSIIKGMFSDY